jgi:hypothetical protein
MSGEWVLLNCPTFEPEVAGVYGMVEIAVSASHDEESYTSSTLNMIPYGGSHSTDEVV